VNQQTPLAFITAGATAVGIGSELLPQDALKSRQEQHDPRGARIAPAILLYAAHSPRPSFSEKASSSPQSW